jgi:hypothetical protein
MRFSFFHAIHEDISDTSRDNYSHKDIEVRDGVLDAETDQVASVTPLLVELIGLLLLADV